jgi:hypothetical protein
MGYIHFAGRSEQCDTFSVFEIFSGYYDRSISSEDKIICHQYFYLSLLPGRSDNSDISYLPFRSGNGHGLIAGILPRLGDISEFRQLISFAEKLLYIHLGEMKVSIGNSNGGSHGMTDKMIK